MPNFLHRPVRYVVQALHSAIRTRWPLADLLADLRVRNSDTGFSALQTVQTLVLISACASGWSGYNGADESVKDVLLRTSRLVAGCWLHPTDSFYHKDDNPVALYTFYVIMRLPTGEGRRRVVSVSSGGISWAVS